jgi:hypothetical protein
MYMIEETTALTYVHDRGVHMLDYCLLYHVHMLRLLSPLSCTYVRTVVSSIMYICWTIIHVHDRGDNTPIHVHDRGDNTPTHMYMIDETAALTYVHDRGENIPTYVQRLLSPLSCTYVRTAVSSIMYMYWGIVSSIMYICWTIVSSIMYIC